MAQGKFIQIKDREYSYFAGNDYLGLAVHQEIVRAGVEAMQKYGSNFSASRITTGTHYLHLQLEKQLASFKNSEDAVVFASGYLSNTILLDVLKDRFDAVFYDEWAHASILDGIPKSVQNVFAYRHLDSNHLEQLLKGSRVKKPLIITDGVFALTGEVSPLNEINVPAEKYNALVVIDDAHGTGVLGATGKGTSEHFNLETNPNIFQTETMSKALGGYGGFIASEKNIEDIRDFSSVYRSSTALSPALVASGIASLKIVMEQPELRKKLHKNANYLRKGIVDLGYQTSSINTPILPILFNEEKQAIQLSDFFKKNGIVAPFVKYSSQPDWFIVRATVSAIHSQQQLNHFLEVLKKA